MVSANCMDAMYMGTEATTATTLTWSSQTDFEIACFVDAAELMRILVENGYNATLMVNENSKTRKKKTYLVSVVCAG